MHKDIQRVLLSEKDIDAICKRLGEEISRDYEGKEILFIGLLKGCQPFCSDLLKYIEPYSQVDYMTVSSYHGTTESSGQVNIKKDIETDIKDKHVIIVDDIVDTGVTIKEVTELLLKRGAKSIEVATLLDKKEGRKVNVNVKYTGTDVEKVFVVGYGLDYDEFYRNLPYIGILKEEVYKK